MTPKEKDLLLRDLCARLPYGLKVKCEKYSFPVTILYGGNIDEVKFIETGGIENICAIKPYLFPISSMTEEQKEEYVLLQEKVIYNGQSLVNLDVMKYIDWCYKHHIDINGLIPIGLAIDATGLDIY